MDEISVDLKNWKDAKFTDKTKQKIKNDNKKEKENDKEDSKEQKGVKNEEESVQGNGNKPVEVSDFDKKHPRLAKIKNFFKNTYKKVTEVFAKPEEKKEKESESKLTSEQIVDRKVEFYKRLAETGNFAKLPTDGKMNEAMKKQEEIKKSIDEGR